VFPEAVALYGVGLVRYRRERLFDLLSGVVDVIKSRQGWGVQTYLSAPYRIRFRRLVSTLTHERERYHAAEICPDGYRQLTARDRHLFLALVDQFYALFSGVFNLTETTV
jgi:hypothetical protein